MLRLRNGTGTGTLDTGFYLKAKMLYRCFWNLYNVLHCSVNKNLSENIRRFLKFENDTFSYLHYIEAVFRIRIRIQSGQWIRIRIQEGKNDPQKFKK